MAGYASGRPSSPSLALAPRFVHPCTLARRSVPALRLLTARGAHENARYTLGSRFARRWGRAALGPALLLLATHGVRENVRCAGLHQDFFLDELTRSLC